MKSKTIFHVDHYKCELILLVFINCIYSLLYGWGIQYVHGCIHSMCRICDIMVTTNDGKTITVGSLSF